VESHTSYWDARPERAKTPACGNFDRLCINLRVTKCSKEWSYQPLVRLFQSLGTFSRVLRR